MSDSRDRILEMAMHRYEAIAAYVADDPARGRRRSLLERLAAKAWTRPDGRTVNYSVETLRRWIHRYRCGGLDGLRDGPRGGRQSKILAPAVVEEACRLKKEVPERSVRRIIRIMEEFGVIEPGSVRRSTLHRALKAQGLSARCVKPVSDQDLDRWQADFANDLWQADMLTGPWLPDPLRPGKMRRAYLYAFLDDASRLLLHGRFAFKGDLPALELVLRKAVQRWGLPRRVYYDNAWTFRSRRMKEICARLGIHRPVHTIKRRPMGHGKIEAFNRLCRNAFVAEVKASRIQTLDELNEAFVAWADDEYNTAVHSELKATPLDRWHRDVKRLRYADEDLLRQAFLWREKRTPDKCGVFNLFGVRYQVGSRLARKRIEVRYDPENLDELEVWYGGCFEERVRPFEPSTHRRAHVSAPEPEPSKGPCTDYLGRLVSKRRKRLRDQGAPEDAAATKPTEADDVGAFIATLRDRLDPGVCNDAMAAEFFRRYGPFDVVDVARTLDGLLASERADQHLTLYLEAIRRDAARARDGDER